MVKLVAKGEGGGGDEENRNLPTSPPFKSMSIHPYCCPISDHLLSCSPINFDLEDDRKWARDGGEQPRGGERTSREGQEEETQKSYKGKAQEWT